MNVLTNSDAFAGLSAGHFLTVCNLSLCSPFGAPNFSGQEDVRSLDTALGSEANEKNIC
jgi:hypothetical protein